MRRARLVCWESSSSFRIPFTGSLQFHNYTWRRSNPKDMIERCSWGLTERGLQKARPRHTAALDGMSNLCKFFLFLPPGPQACPWSFRCLNASKCHHLGQRQPQSMGTDCSLEVFLAAELLIHTSSSPGHSLESFCFLDCPACTPARSQLATNRTVIALLPSLPLPEQPLLSAHRTTGPSSDTV